MLKTAQHIHFVGIGGIGMSALALLLQQQGKTVSGSDQLDSKLLGTLRTAGIEIHIGHVAQQAAQADLVVFSSAVKADNPERVYADNHHIPEIRRAELLGQIASAYTHTIAVAGTHGKTTTTGMLGQILVAAGRDPGILVGGILPDLGGNLRLGRQDYLVVEADEYDRSFLALDPDQIIVTTLEADHLDIYQDLQDIRDTFLQFITKLDTAGTLILQGDDQALIDLVRRSPHPALSYGFSDQVDYRATAVQLTGFTADFAVSQSGKSLGKIHLNMPGRHNVMNALAATAMSLELGLDFSAIQRGLESFRGVERRFQLRGSRNGVQFIDDYAHHPAELAATLQAARTGWPDSRIIAIFQPHLYSRTRDFAEDFAFELAAADLAIVMPIYPAREQPIPGVSADLIIQAGNSHLQYLSDLDQLEVYLELILQPGDLVITMGAGDIWKLHDRFVEQSS